MLPQAENRTTSRRHLTEFREPEILDDCLSFLLIGKVESAYRTWSHNISALRHINDNNAHEINSIVPVFAEQVMVVDSMMERLQGNIEAIHKFAILSRYAPLETPF